jgi:hypothetical protein
VASGAVGFEVAIDRLGEVASSPLVVETDKSHRAPLRCSRAYWIPGRGFEIPCGRRTCPFCGRKRARITARMLKNDALIDAPGWAVCLTTRDPHTTGDQVRRGSNAVWQALRREYTIAEYFGRVEFTTGLAPLSGGYRRIHVHYCVKGLPCATVDRATEIARHAWMGQNVGAWRVEVAGLRTPAAALHYLNLHHAKAEQLPPLGWNGRTERVSRGYWSSDPKALREEARRQLWAEGLAYSTGLSVEDARFAVDQQCASKEHAAAIRAAIHDVGEWVPIELAPEPQQLTFYDDSDIPF